MNTMVFPGTWLTKSESVAYRVVPKCGCSTIGQILYYSDNGEFFNGDIHDASDGLHKWHFEHSQTPIVNNVSKHKSYTFSCVRNPYTRILSSFFDKICGIQRSGGYYRDRLVPLLMQNYGIDVGRPEDGFEFDQIKSFRRFLLFVRDTLKWYRPMAPDIHWISSSAHISTLISGGGGFDNIFWLERFKEGMQSVLDNIETPYPVNLDDVPRFNESEMHGPKRAHPVADYFDDLSMHLMYDVYKMDFELFKYNFDDPSNPMPQGEIDYNKLSLVLKDYV